MYNLPPAGVRTGRGGVLLRFKATLILVGLAASTLGYVLYCLGRASISGGDDRSLFEIVFALSFATVALTLLCTAVLVPLLVALGVVARLRQRRVDRGECGGCGYHCGGIATCPECGGDPRSWPAPGALRLLLCALLAWYIGGTLGFVMGESRMRIEEERFRREAAAICARTGQPSHYRIRAWPAGNSGMSYDAATRTLRTID